MPHKSPRSDLALLRYLVVFLLLLGNESCKVNYSFTGASISPETKTVSVQFFKNNAQLVQPTLSQSLTEALKDRFVSETSLTLVEQTGDLDFEGEITNYVITPIAIQGNETAALNRLTVSIRVIFVNYTDEKQSFETNFSRYEDYESSQDLSSVEENLINNINAQLVEDIFNKALVNW
jgi:hypothetical protein